MVNWYYVLGSERVGPITMEALKQLFLSDEISLETYVWKKGFQNWERLKDVAELKFDSASASEVHVIAPTPTPIVKPVSVPEKEVVKEDVKEESSPEIFFSFDWKKVKENEELFFIRIGRDRKNFDGSDIFGPYSQVEIKEAIAEKRMNFQTLIFSPGMSSWTKIQDTPLNENYNGVNQTVGLNEIPLVLVFNYSPLPLITVVKKTGTRDGILLGAGPFLDFQNQTVKASLYVGNEIKAKNVKVRMQNYDKKEQTIHCQFLDLDQDAKRIMLNHAV